MANVPSNVRGVSSVNLGCPGNPAARWSADLSAVRAVQATLAAPRMVNTAKAMSLFGEHAIGWLALGSAAAVVDRRRRGKWLEATARVAAAHAVAVAVKRVVRRNRPTGTGIRALTDTCGRLGFPSAHAASTTAAAVAFGRVADVSLTPILVPILVPPMALSRLVLGVHFPSDVVAGSMLGALIGSGGRPRDHGGSPR